MGQYRVRVLKTLKKNLDLRKMAADVAWLTNATNATTPTGVVTEVASLLAPLTPIGRHLLAVFCVLLGLLALFAGKKFLRTTLFVLGFGCGFCFCVLILSRFDGVDNDTTLIAASVAGAVVGALGACVGAAARAIIGLGIAGFLTYGFVRIGGVSAIGDDTVVWVVVAVCAGLACFVIWKALDAATVVVTSLAGALLVIVSASHFIPAIELEPLEVFGHPSEATCTAAAVNPAEHRGNNGTVFGNSTFGNGTRVQKNSGDAINGCMIELICWAVLSSIGLVFQWKLWECMDGNSGSKNSQSRDEVEGEDVWNVEIGPSKSKKSSKRRATAAPTRAERRATSKSKSYLSGSSPDRAGKKRARSKSSYTRVPAKDRRSGW
jgi:hypothetical protein